MTIAQERDGTELDNKLGGDGRGQLAVIVMKADLVPADLLTIAPNLKMQSGARRGLGQG